MNRASSIRRVLLLTLILNLLVSGAKILYGYFTNSVAMISDGFHSIFDGVSNVVGIVGMVLSSQPPDEAHPYGHRKYETVFTIFVGVLMFVTAIEIFKRVYDSLLGKHETMVTIVSFTVMLITLSVNVFVSTYEKRKGKKLNSEFLVADSQHTRSDIYVSLGVITSLILIKLGVPFADPVVGAFVGVAVIKAGFGIIKESTEVLVDRAQTDINEIREIACSVEGVKECHAIRARGTKGNVFIDLHMLVDPSTSVENAHAIAEDVEKEIKKKVPDIVDVVVHIEPSIDTH